MWMSVGGGGGGGAVDAQAWQGRGGLVLHV